MQVDGERELFKMLVKSVESLDWQTVHQEWCEAGYDRVELKDRDIWLEVKRGQRTHSQLESIVQNQIKLAGFEVTQTRNWADRHDRRLGLKVVDKLGHEPWGKVTFTVLGFTWIETCVRAQYLLHLLGIDTHYRRAQ